MKYRLYIWVFSHMSPSQKMVQAAHVSHEIVFQNRDNPFLNEWAQLHKTIVLLEGGNYDNLTKVDTVAFNYAKKCGLPYACFIEDRETFGGLQTAVAVVVPEDLYCLQPIRDLVAPVYNALKPVDGKLEAVSIPPVDYAFLLAMKDSHLAR